MDELQSYDEVITSLVRKKREHHLLIGNGFSMAYDSKIFSYNALQKFVENIDNELLNKLFGIIKTKNFEIVMQQLDNFCELINAFGADEKLLEKVISANAELKYALVDAVKSLHPEHVFKIPSKESKQCAEFLNVYISNGGHVFSTNYDLLLYWVLMKESLENCIDGFGRFREDDLEDYESDPEYSELIWGKHKNMQNIHYVHGALPIFDEGVSIVKEQYSGQQYLLENIQERINSKEYPIFVASGNGDEKLNHIMHNRYLSFCYEKLSTIKGSLVTFGFNFGDSDKHIIDAINIAAKYGKKSAEKLYSVYIGVYTEDDKQHIERKMSLFKCKVNMFDAKTVRVWR
jgi:hypothetical protein